MAAFEEDGEYAEMAHTLAKDGLIGVKDMMMKKVNSWKKVKLSIAVIGGSGSGKSAYINAIRDLTADDEESADTGATETTNELKSYIHPQHPNLEFWDLPGVGTPSFPRETYLKQVNFQIYDFFFILSAARFTENDFWLAKSIQQSGRKFFFIRTKIDVAIQGEKLSKPKSFDERDVLQKIRSDCRKNLENCGLRNPTVFLLSSFEKEIWDFKAAEEKLITDSPDLTKEAILFSLSCHTTKIIDEKKKMLSKRIFKIAVASAMWGANSAIIEKEGRFYKQQFGLDEKSLELTANTLGLSTDTLKNGIAQTTETPSRVAMFILSIGIPVIGYLIAAGVTYRSTVMQLRKLLNNTEADARSLAAFVQASVRASAMHS